MIGCHALHFLGGSRHTAKEITAADRLIVESPTREGMVMIRVLVRERGLREAIRARLAEASCLPSS